MLLFSVFFLVSALDCSIIAVPSLSLIPNFFVLWILLVSGALSLNIPGIFVEIVDEFSTPQLSFTFGLKLHWS